MGPRHGGSRPHVRGVERAEPRWFVAGTWVVGPYPFDDNNLEADLARARPPESNPDPSRPVVGPDGKATLAWKAVSPPPTASSTWHPWCSPTDRVSAYVLVRVYSPEEKDVVALITNDDWLRFWCNGELILAQPLCFERPFPCRSTSAPGGTPSWPRSRTGEAVLGQAPALERPRRGRPCVLDLRRQEGVVGPGRDRLERLYALVPDHHGRGTIGRTARCRGRATRPGVPPRRRVAAEGLATLAGAGPIPRLAREVGRGAGRVRRDDPRPPGPRGRVSSNTPRSCLLKGTSRPTGLVRSAGRTIR